MRFLRLPIALLFALTAPVLALDAGQRASTPKDPSPNLNRPVVKQLNLPDGPAGLILGAKPLSELLPAISDGGDMMLLPGRKLGRFQDGKLTLQPDAVQIQGAGSTGDVSATSATRSDGRGAGTLGALLGQTSARFFPENYGAPASETADAAPAILAAIAAATPVRGEVVLRSRTYALLSTVRIPSEVTLRFEGATLKPLGNFTAVRISHRSNMDGWGVIGVDIPGYTSALVEGSGAETIFSSEIRGAIRLVNFSGSYTGIGYRLAAPSGGKIAFTTAIFDEIKGFARAVSIVGTGTGFANSNYVFARSYYNNIEAIVTEAADYNDFGGAIQPEGQSVRALRFAGEGNKWNGMIYDWHTAADPGTAITFMPGSRRSVVRSIISPDLVEDQASPYRTEANVIEDQQNAAPSARSVLPPSMRFQTYAGNQDDYLAFAKQRLTVTQTTGPAPIGGDLSFAFDLNGGNGVAWTASASNPITIEVDFGTKAPDYLMGLGASFNYGGVPTDISLETYNGSSWSVQRKFTKNGRARVNWQTENFVPGVRKVRLTMSAASGTISLERFFAHAVGGDGGYAFRPTFSDAPLVLKDGGAPIPTPIPGYAQMYRDPNDFKWKLMEGNGNIKTFVFE